MPSLLMAAMLAPSSKAGWKRSVSLHWKSSSGPITLKVLNYSHADGLSSALLRGWDGVADWPKTSRKPSLPPKRGSISQISASPRGGSQRPDIVAFFMIQALSPSQRSYGMSTCCNDIPIPLANISFNHITISSGSSEYREAPLSHLLPLSLALKRRCNSSIALGSCSIKSLIRLSFSTAQ